MATCALPTNLKFVCLWWFSCHRSTWLRTLLSYLKNFLLDILFYPHGPQKDFTWNPSGMFAQHNSSSIYRTFCFVSKKCSKACCKCQTQTYLRKGSSIWEEDESNFRNLYLENSEAAAFRGCVNVRRNPNTEVIQMSFHFTSSFCCPHLWWCFSFIWGNLIKCDFADFSKPFYF